MVGDFFKRRVGRPIANLLKQGMSPRTLSATVAIGAVVGVIPFLGITTIIATALAARFRLNIAATVLVSYLVQPLQLLLAIPFIRLGIWALGLSELRLTLDDMVAMFKEDWLYALQKLWVANLAGISAWAVLAIPAGFILYLLLIPVFNKVLPLPVANNN